MNLAVHGYSEFLVVDQWNNVVCGRQTIHLKAASSISEAAKSNDRIASRENNAFVPLSPGKIDLEIELKTKGVHQTKIKFASI